MTPQDGFLELINIIRYDLRPALYKEMCAIAEEAQMYDAKESEKQRERLEQLRKTESEAQINQRVRLTSPITGIAREPVFSYTEEIYRSDGITKDIANDGVPNTAKARIEEHLASFYDNKSLHRYCFEAAKMAARLDPNM